jgi:3-hydroxyisobutyrate dehydrogenase-like beta-hydroxyacid dehydrogenase
VEPHPDKGRVLAAERPDLAETPGDAVREAAFVITMLTNGAAVLSVMGQAAERVETGTGDGVRDTHFLPSIAHARSARASLSWC